ncbi:hypothetical protein [Sorangium sp. So ce1097]|uniref:hypothetical protein n=1 Tax=Sorangium sp. So ce1097 TaxID=3133330 RepID=UPI003F5DF174
MNPPSTSTYGFCDQSIGAVVTGCGTCPEALPVLLTSIGGMTSPVSAVTVLVSAPERASCSEDGTTRSSSPIGARSSTSHVSSAPGGGGE